MTFFRRKLVFETSNLRKTLSLNHLVSFGISATVGSGILMTVGPIANHYAGPYTWLSFGLAMIVASLSGLIYAEFATRVPSSGQAYSYAYYSLGEGYAFILGWLSAMPSSVASAAVARGFSSYLLSFLESILSIDVMDNYMWLFSINLTDSINLSIVPTGECFLMTVLAYAGVSESATVAYIFAIMNLVLIFSICLYGNIYYSNYHQLYEYQVPNGFIGIFEGAGIAYFSCAGWDALCTLSEEVKNPCRVVPRAIGLTLIICCSIYVLLSVSLCAMSASSDEYLYLSDRAPVSDIFIAHNNHIASMFSSLLAVTICAPAILTGITSQSRILFRMAKDSLLPPIFMELNTNDVPKASTLLCGSIATILSGMLSFQKLAKVVSLCSILILVFVAIGLLFIRFREIDVPTIEEETFPSINDSVSSDNSIDYHPINNKGERRLSIYIVLLITSSYLSAICLHYELYTISIVFCLLVLISVYSIVYLYNHAASETAGVMPFFGSRSYRDSLSFSEGIYNTSDYKFNLYQPFIKNNDTHIVTVHHQHIFKCPFVPILPIISIVLDVYLIYSLGLVNLLLSISWIVIGLFVYKMYN